MGAFKLLVEAPNLSDFNYVLEEKNSKEPANMYIQGPFMMASEKNRNNRVYDLDEMAKEVDRYINEMIRQNRAMGELNHPECLTKNADILTENGWKSIVDVQVGEFIPTLNHDTGDIEVKQIERKIDEPYKGKMYRLHGRNIDVTVTPNHKFPLVHRYGKRELVSISDIVADRKKYNKSYIPKLGNWYSDVTEIVIPGIKDVNINYFKNKNICDDLVVSSKLFSKFIGIWLAEGHISSEKSVYTVLITQKKEPVKTMIREMLEEFPLDFAEYVKEDGNSQFSIRDIRLHNYLSNLSNCYSKCVPKDVKNFCAADLEELLYWFNLGDGRFNTITHGDKSYSVRNVFSVSKRLIDDLHECLIKSGGCGNISEIEPDKDYMFADHMIYAENKSTLHLLNIASTKGIYLDDRYLKIEEVEFDDNVYCVNVPNHTFYCRENGKAHWTGNSPDVNLERACHLVTELTQDGNIFYGKSKVLSTPCGQIVRNLIKDDVRVGVSSRALGQIEEQTDGSNLVKEMKLVAVDCVADPSFPKAFVNGILESKEWIIKNDGKMEECYDEFERKLQSLPKKELDKYILEQVLGFIKKL